MSTQKTIQSISIEDIYNRIGAVKEELDTQYLSVECDETAEVLRDWRDRLSDAMEKLEPLLDAPERIAPAPRQPFVEPNKLMHL